ncbi:MAG: class I SAM-dependent methyltransferase [Corynebacterium sp.]|nr:class I SAM-dependent methyltransferase [Corynebacterium sp.]
MKRTRAHATLRRSIKLLRSFKYEQTRPDVFYGGLATDTAAQIAALAADCSLSLADAPVLDVGGGPGYFAAAFAHHGAHYFGVEPDAGEMSAAGISVANAVRGDGTALPFADDTFSVVYSSNVAEHIPHPFDMAEEMVRVTRPGGLMVFSYTVWLGPFGGHETGLWPHYLGGHFARRRYEKKNGHPPKNVFGTSLFALSARAGLRWARSTPHTVVATFPRYHPAWAWWITRVPILREFLTSNLVIVLQKRENGC